MLGETMFFYFYFLWAKLNAEWRQGCCQRRSIINSKQLKITYIYVGSPAEANKRNNKDRNVKDSLLRRLVSMAGTKIHFLSIHNASQTNIKKKNRWNNIYLKCSPLATPNQFVRNQCSSTHRKGTSWINPYLSCIYRSCIWCTHMNPSLFSFQVSVRLSVTCHVELTESGSEKTKSPGMYVPNIRLPVMTAYIWCLKITF